MCCTFVLRCWVLDLSIGGGGLLFVGMYVLLDLVECCRSEAVTD